VCLADGTREFVLTFINNLKADLERSLGDAARVFTLHAYCQYLLRRHAELRGGLTASFRCYPGLVSLIKQDWEWLERNPAPKFVDLMRNLSCTEEHKEFYFERSHYYNAVDYDDSVYRVQCNIKGVAPRYELVLIDEFQDFNAMEAAVIDALADVSPIVIAGDDDQALYSELRSASWDYIRAHYEGGHYDIFQLPFCMRCPEVIVGAVSDIVQTALRIKKLDGRIDKPYRYFEPVKGDDSHRFPTIDLAETSVQRGNANYFGRFIEECITAIPEAEVKLAAEKFEPAALIIGSNPYRRQVQEYLIERGLVSPEDVSGLHEREQALEMLHEDPQSNLGWRIMLSLEEIDLVREVLRAAYENNSPLFNIVPGYMRSRILEEAKAWTKKADPEDDGESEKVPPVKITSFEGSKGLSAQYVFIVGIHSGDLPRDAEDIKDIEICRFVVALTRTKRKCAVLVTRRFGEDFKRRSEFIGWIKPARFEEKNINAEYWKKNRR
jgi:superfamily I DNA/RNA helicase